MKKILFILASVFCFYNSDAQILNTSFCQTNGTVYAVAVDSANNIVYIGGSFSQVCGTSRNKLAALNLTTGALISTFNPGANQVVTAMYIHRGALYVGGQFTTVGGQPHPYVAKFNSATGVLSTWKPTFTTGNQVSAIVARGSSVYVGGNLLMTVGTGNQICELDTATANPISWSAYPNDFVNALSIDGNYLYAGGNFKQVGFATQNYIAKFDISGGGGAVLQSWTVDPDNAVYSLCAKSGRLFVGGMFSFIGTDNREKIAEVDVTTGLATSWDPSSNNTVSDITYRNGVVYAIGNFNVIGTKSRSFVAAIDVNTGHATNWDAQVDATVLKTAVSQGKIFLGGAFSTAVSQPRVNFAVLCVNPIDTLTDIPDGPTTVCAGVNGITYSVSPVVGATSYSWSYSGTGATIVGTSNSITINFSASVTDGTLSVAATNGCETSNTQTVAISTYTFTASASPNATSMTCGDAIDIYSSDNYSGSGSITYGWTPATGLNTTNSYSTTTGVHSTTTYTLTETSTEGCVAQDFVTITVSPYNLTTYASFGSVLCSVKDTLHVTNDYPGAGAVTYTWSPSASVTTPNASLTTALPLISTDYTVTSTAVGGCVATPQVVSVSVNPITVTPSTTSSLITCGETTQLSATNDYPGTGTLTYTWTPSAGISNTHITNPVANPIVNTSYVLTLSSPEGCVSAENINVDVDPLQISLASTVNAGCHQPTTLTTSANTSNPGLTYSWTPSLGLSSTTSASPNATVGSNTSYNVTMSLPSSGCADASNSVSVVLITPAAPEICLVTVDSLSQNNLIVWDKTLYPTADTFYVYRDTANNNFCIVGRIKSSALSEYADTARHIGAVNGDPNITTYRYKLGYKDSCGNVSPMSPYHNTIYQYNSGSLFLWNAYQIEGQPTPVPGLSSYVLKRDNLGATGNYITAATAGAASTSINDPQYGTYQTTADWRVETVWSITCQPSYLMGNNSTQAAIVKSKSNISNNRTTAIKKTEAAFNVYPNPTNGNFTINFTNSTSGKVNVKVISVLGTEAYNETFTQSTEKVNVDLSKCESGIYLVQITTNNSTVVKRIVKQ